MQFAVGLFLPRARRISVAVSAFCITHTSWHPVILQPPGPLRPAGGFPALPGGALLPRLLRGLCHRGTRVRQVIPRSSLSYVLARPRLPFISLDALAGHRPGTGGAPAPTTCGRSAGHRFHASFRRGLRIYPGWRLGFRQSSFSHIARVPQRTARTHRHGRWFPGMLLSPSPFRSR